ncbi:hypothetical protein [Pseudomonas fluorescens]|uniref:hypothetical protein n=1 Tax=Pseudomonas fluorescens TaxID=294 RepID=UPI00124136B7|nr:hypothetical protein [Pseudomonas fluorescens]
MKNQGRIFRMPTNSQQLLQLNSLIDVTNGGAEKESKVQDINKKLKNMHYPNHFECAPPIEKQPHHDTRQKLINPPVIDMTRVTTSLLRKNRLLG